jgi:hypothetical protein
VGAGRRRTRLIVVGLVVLVLAAGGAVAWFQPQKLFIDDRVDESIPVADAARPAGPSASGGRPPAVRTLSTARFRSHEHATQGRARVIEVGGRRYVRFEAFRTSNGPLLKVTRPIAQAGS